MSIPFDPGPACHPSGEPFRNVFPRPEPDMELPPPPPGALGWNVYSGPVEGKYTWHEFVPAPDLDEKLATMADQLAEEIAGSDDRPA